MQVRPRVPELTAPDLEEIEALAERDAGEHCRGPLLALVAEVRRLRAARQASPIGYRSGQLIAPEISC
jgi:hypothetical protein